MTSWSGMWQIWLAGPMYATDVRMEFSGVPIEQIADAVGPLEHPDNRGRVRHQLRPVTRTAAIALGPLFETKGKTDGGQS
jgi:hypothetical protein